jgi:hypothetical protein
MRVLLDSAGGPSPLNMRFEDSNRDALGKHLFYLIEPYSSPHAFRGIQKGYAVFENWEPTQILLNHNATALRVSAYDSEKLDEFFSGFTPESLEDEGVRRLNRGLLDFLKREIDRHKIKKASEKSV